LKRRGTEVTEELLVGSFGFMPLIPPLTPFLCFFRLCILSMLSAERQHLNSLFLVRRFGSDKSGIHLPKRDVIGSIPRRKWMDYRESDLVRLISLANITLRPQLAHLRDVTTYRQFKSGGG
jgi:hypothetical protein